MFKKNALVTQKSRRGFTLIELIMVIIIVGVLTGISSLYIKETIDLWRFLTFRNEVISQERIALMRMSREIRQIKDAYSITSANAQQFQFTDSNSAPIGYLLSGSNLLRNADVLAERVSALTFTYYNKTNQIIATPQVAPNKTDIYLININMTVQSGTQSKTLKTQVYPRNL